MAIGELEVVLDQSRHRYLRSFVTAPNGTNFRNEAFHGFVEAVGPVGAALVLISVDYLLDVSGRTRRAARDRRFRY